MSFRLVPKSATVNTNPNLYLLATLNDLERRNGRYFGLFQRIRCFRPHCVKVVEYIPELSAT